MRFGIGRNADNLMVLWDCPFNYKEMPMQYSESSSEKAQLHCPGIARKTYDLAVVLVSAICVVSVCWEHQSDSLRTM